jgi:hypothetical protein
METRAAKAWPHFIVRHACRAVEMNESGVRVEWVRVARVVSVRVSGHLFS